jgi:hypothetical protein
MSLRILRKVSPRQSPSSAILLSISSDADRPSFEPDFFMWLLSPYQDQHACGDCEDRHEGASSGEAEIKQRHCSTQDQPDCQQEHAEIPGQSEGHSKILL